MGSWMQWANKPYGRRVRMGAVALAACGVWRAGGMRWQR